MVKKSIIFGLCLVAFAVCAPAQTTVTSSGTTATTGNVPYVSAATAASTSVSPSPVYVLNSNVGIGTPSPGAKLHISDLGSSWGSPKLLIQNTTANDQITLGFKNAVATTPYDWEFAGINSNGSLYLRDNTGGGKDVIIAYPGASGILALQASGGYVGINTTNPSAQLEIDGNVKLTANSGASITYADGTAQNTAWTGVLCGGDYAEAMNAAGGKAKYQPGDVLVLASGNNDDVQKSADPYSTMVAGIYATKPGVIGRRAALAKSTEDIPMAMVGVVPTKVTTENGPIRKGDLLVTSSTPGYAMRGTDRSRMFGAVIGKAMGRWIRAMVSSRFSSRCNRLCCSSKGSVLHA